MPLSFLGTPSLSWDAILNMIKVMLELIPYPDIYSDHFMFFGKGSRGEISYISNR